jgi:hypothetical protein
MLQHISHVVSIRVYKLAKYSNIDSSYSRYNAISTCDELAAVQNLKWTKLSNLLV